MQFPVNISNRIAYGLASMSLGGKDVKSVPDHCLSAADFPLTSEEEFDNWSGCADLKLEKRPKIPMTLNAWYRNALRQGWAIACVYGTEHYSSFEQAATFMLKLGEEFAYMWPAHSIFSVWEELWSRFVEEVRELDRELRRAMKEDAPTFERMRFFATAPGSDGEPWLRLPRTFFLEDDREYFQTDVLPRHNRMLSRACWQVALKKQPSNHLQGGKAGEAAEASESRPATKTGKNSEGNPKPLLGPQLTNKEAARALDHRPKERKGSKYLCWDFMCHRGCVKPGACPHAHGPLPKWESMDWTVQLQLLRRGGLKNQPALDEGQVIEQSDAIRKAQLAKTKEHINDGKKVKKVGEKEPTLNPEAKVGKSPDSPRQVKFAEGPPEEFTKIFPTEQESEMANLLEGPDETFFEDQDKEKGVREVTLELTPLGEKTAARHKLMQEVDSSQLSEGYNGLLQTYLKNQLLQRKEENPSRTLSTQDVREVLEKARDEGGPELSTAADEALQGVTAQRAGFSPNVGVLSRFVWDGEVGKGSLQWEGGQWSVLDFGDRLYPKGTWPEELLGKPLAEGEVETRQCLLLHCAAGYLHKIHNRPPSWEEVQATTNSMRAELVQQASEASRHLGECPDHMPRSEADLRVFVHDLLHWSHDKDYRTMAAFPSDLLVGYDLHIIRMAADGDLSTEKIQGVLSAGTPKQAIHLLVHQGHMRLLLPEQLDRSPPTIREVLAAGWECHLEAATGSEASVRARDYLNCPRCAEPEEIPRRYGLRPPSVLGLHLKGPPPQGKLGAWQPGILEHQDIDPSCWSHDDVRAWLGPQAGVFDQARKRGLDFLEIYAGAARTSQAVLAKGGLAIYLGLDHGQDFRRARDRSLALALVDLLKPRHCWAAFPCTPFCAWIRLAILRNCDMTQRLKEGRLHLKFSLELLERQRLAGRQGHIWRILSPLWLGKNPWLYARWQTRHGSAHGWINVKPVCLPLQVDSI